MSFQFKLLLISSFLLIGEQLLSQKKQPVSNFRIDQENCYSLQETLVRLMSERKKRNQKSENIEILQQCLSRAKKLNCSFSIGYCHEMIGSIYFDNGLIDKAVQEYLKGITHYTKLAKNEDLARLQNKLGVAFTFQGYYEKGLNSHLIALNLLKKINFQNSELMADVYTNLATVYEEENRGKEVLKYLDLALKIYKTKNNQISIADVYNNYGKYYFNKEKNILFAKEYYEKAFDIKNKFPESISLAVTSFNLGIIYLENLNDLKKAAIYFEKTKSISISFENVYYHGMALQGLGEVYRKNKDFQKSEEFLLEAVKLQKSVNSLPELNMCYESLYQLYRDKGNFKLSLEYKIMQIKIRDSIYNQEKSQQFLELERKFKDLDRNKELELIKRDQKIKEIEVRKNQTILWIVISTFFILILVVWIYIRSLDKQKLLKIENKNAKVKMSALSSQINSHFIANTLVSIKNYINQNDIFKGSEVIDDFSLLMRQILIKSQESLIPLKEDIEILKLYIQLEIENNSHSFDYEINISEELKTDSIFVPPMLFQPLVENAIKYRGKNLECPIRISFLESDKNLQVEISNSGAKLELNETKLPINQGEGIRNVRDRIDLYNQFHKTTASMAFTYTSNLNIVILTIPLNYERKSI
ncbi:MAG: hypothetical protein RL264_2552 [Bacteroidota bacterium]|jgi:tetratricopeptide (TPR) repeat protein